MRKRSVLILIVFVFLAWSSAACESSTKMVKRNLDGTPTLTPFAAKATYTVTNTPMKSEGDELAPSQTITATIDPALTEQTSEATITGEPSITPSETLTQDITFPTVSATVSTASPSATPKPTEATSTATPNIPSATPKPGEPFATTAPTEIPSITPDQPIETNTHIPPAATFTPEPPTQTPVPAATQTPVGCTISGNTGYENQVVTLINKERTDRGLGALSTNSSLRTAARWHSEDMACNDFFSHTGSGGSTLSSRILAAGYGYTWAAENIAASSSCSFSAQSVVNMWMNSSGHRANILNANAVHIGVGFRCVNDGKSGDLDAYYTADFGRP